MPDGKEWEAIFELAQKQSVVGICLAGLQQLGSDLYDEVATIGMSSDLYYDWVGTAAGIQQANEVLNQQCLDLQNRLLADGFRSCILKGQGVGSLYGDLAMLRQPGDIDVWIESGRDDVISYVKRICPEEDVDISSRHIEFKIFKDTVVEAHFVPVSVRTPILRRRVREYYDSEKSGQMSHTLDLASGQRVVAPDRAFQAVQILHHAFGHFLFEGVGMRQLMDYYFVMQQPFSPEEQTKVMKTVKRFGMYSFAKGVSYILLNVFGAKDCFIPEDEKMGRRILKSVMSEGNFGVYDKKRDGSKMGSSWYRFWYHNFRLLKFVDMAPWIVIMSPFERIGEYLWRLAHGYFKK